MSTFRVLDSEPGDLQALKRRLWDAVQAAHGILKSRKHDDKLRACHALGQLSNAYVKLCEVADLEARVAALETAKEGEKDAA